MSRRDHVAAVLARLREHPDLTDRVFVGVANRDDNNQPRTRYVTVFVGSPRRTVGRFLGSQSTERYRFTIHATSIDADDAGDLSDAVTEQLFDWTPEVPDRVCRRMTSNESDELQYDSDLTPPLYWIPATWELVTDPAPQALVM
ncbi:hypothetical protein [Curtobacterium sp. ISL-83]|uniref:hypothetical protein n=1 Tax=Curtobacterium sp. ISL-83 TaxID=2819145 RepID=UPI001BE8E17C|nr:hypothetical protein [Curtobacterium sp. ISL-83]MBT2502980.1 hypothetical protein [Curtobacterium sp. ISL-83]